MHNQFLGCIENVTYNNQIFTFQHLSINRRQCSSSEIILKSIKKIYIDQIISFQEYDRPLIVILDNPKEFYIFSLSFYTQESNSIICSLADKTYENIFILSIHYEHLLLTYTNKQKQRIEMLTNHSINDRNEHRIVIRLINKNNLMFELDGNIIMNNISDIFYINTIYIGRLDGFIKERYADLDGDNFIGCIKDVMLNGKSIIILKNVYQSDRVANICRLTKRERKLIVRVYCPNTTRYG